MVPSRRVARILHWEPHKLKADPPPLDTPLVPSRNKPTGWLGPILLLFFMSASAPEMHMTGHGDQSVKALTTQSVAHWTEQSRVDAGAVSDGHLFNWSH